MTASRVCLFTLLLACLLSGDRALAQGGSSEMRSQVQIRSQFIEVKDTAVEEIGIDWLMLDSFGSTGATEAGQGPAGAGAGGVRAGGGLTLLPPTGLGPIVVAPPTGPRGGTVFGGGSVGDQAGPGHLGLSGILSDVEFQIVVRALNQTEPGTLLSAPSVISPVGGEAQIEVGQGLFNPPGYLPPSVSTEFGGLPGSFVPQTVGVVLDIDPVVTPDATITLNIAPEVVEFEGFIDYGAPISTNLEIRPYVEGDFVVMNVTVGSYFRPNEVQLDVFAGYADGRVTETVIVEREVEETVTVTTTNFEERVVGNQRVQVGTTQRQTGTTPVVIGNDANNQPIIIQVPVFTQEPVFRDQPVIRRVPVESTRQETITRIEREEMVIGSFMDDADIYGLRGTQFYGNYFGVGLLGQYMDGDLDGAWVGQIQAILRYPIECDPYFGIAPYVVLGAGGFFGDDDYVIGSAGAGFDLRFNSTMGIFTEVAETWTDDGQSYTSAIGGLRFVFDGVGPRKTKKRFHLRNGETAFLGGLFDEPSRDEVKKVPLLGDIPVVGRLFRSTSEPVEKRTLLQFVTARFIDPSE